MVRQAKSFGIDVTCDVSANHVHLSEIDIGYFDSNCHLVPPLRSQRDRDGLRRGVEDGTVDAICSDHTPVDDDAKQLPFGESEAGATGLELLLALTLKWADESRVPLQAALARVTSAPARILGIDTGRIAAGDNADICIFDPETRWKVEPDKLKSQGRNTPFAIGNGSDSVHGLVSGKFVTLRVPYPLGFYAKGMDGRIDDPKAGWKGRGIYASSGTRTPFHMEGGKGTRPKLVKFQVRPDPLAK